MYRRISRSWPLLFLSATLGPAGGAVGADCVLNGNPACATVVNLGNLPGDAESQAITRSGVGSTEQVAVTRADTFADNSFTVVIEIRYQTGESCGPWTLTIGGNTAASQAALSCS